MRTHIKQSIIAVLVAVCVFTMGFNLFRFRDSSSKLRLAFWGTNLPYYYALQDAAKKYNEVQDKYEVEIQRQDAANYRIWMSSQLAGGTAPEILATTSVYANADAQNGYLYDFAEVLNKPNPYEGKDTAWKDDFAGTYLSQLEDPNQKGRFTNIPTSTVSVRIVLNMEMLKSKRAQLLQNGIDIDTDLTEDWTFGQFRKICEVFEADGTTPMQIANQQYINYHVSWLLDIFMAQVKYDDITSWDHNGNGLIESEEVCKMILDDENNMDFTRDEDFKQVLTFMKYWSQYWGEGFNSRSDTSENFLRQNVPMLFCGSWGVAGIEMTLGNQNPDADKTNPYTMFEYKALPFPRLTPETYVDSAPGGTFTFTNLREGLPLQEMGEPSGCFCIPLSAEKSGKLEGAIDFLQFFSSTEMSAFMANAAYGIPVIKGVSVNEIMNDFLPPQNSETVRMRFGLQTLSSGTAEEFHFKRMQMYLATGREAIGLNSLCSDIQKKYVEVTSQLAEDNGWYWE